MANEPSESNPNNNKDNSPAEANGTTTTTANTSALRKSFDDLRKASVASAPTITQLKNQATNTLARGASSPSPVSSPRGSRNASPIRKDSNKPQPLTTPLSTQPSAAAIQRALSAANAPQLQQGTVADAVSKLPRQPKSTGNSGDNTPHWPTSPRLKSPPPSSSRRGSSTAAAAAAATKKAETTTAPSISVQSATPQSNNTNTTPAPIPTKANGEDSPRAGGQLQPSSKGPSRGVSGKTTLETVQENSADDLKEPSPAALAAAAELKPTTISDEENQAPKRENALLDGAKTAPQPESGSESAGTKSPRKKDQSAQATRPRNSQTKSYSSLNTTSTTKSRQGDGKQNMTVETETVPSVPQSALTVADRSGTGRGVDGGSVKQKASNEAIRPKKERRKPTSKSRSINQSTTSSKADIFEQRVANAVDEANSSESDETFVYESNPPEPQRRAARHHSRTPSVTSSHSVAEQGRVGGPGMRGFGDVTDDGRRVGGKRSMKFSNNAYNDPDSPDGPGKDGSVRAHTPRHFGRFGRGGTQQSMFDQDSPFTQASKLRSSQRSKPNSPRNGLVGAGSNGIVGDGASTPKGSSTGTGLFGRKQEPSYDFDAEVGDDERTPLFGTVRTQRHTRVPGRRTQRSPSIDEYYGVRSRSRFGRYGTCALAVGVMALAVLSTIVFLVMSNRALYDVQILEIKNVLASEQELILDLMVSAVNPNALGITIADMDLDIFAKSKHVGAGGGGIWGTVDEVSTNPRRRKRRRAAQERVTDVEQSDHWQDLSDHWHSTGGIDHGTDPPGDGDLGRDAQTMLLGRVFHFSQALAFEGTPWKRLTQNSTGELRLEKPGNKTETGGSQRWERVLQNEFELIVRGSLKYQLPISSRLQSVAVGKSMLVHPDNDVDDGEGSNASVEPVDHSEHWQWVSWDEVRDIPQEEK